MSDTPKTDEVLNRLRSIVADLNDTSTECLSALDSIKIIEIERDLAAAQTTIARQQQELDASCSAEELRQVRTELAALREDKARLIDALEACAVFTTPLERLKNWNEYKEHATRLRNAALAACEKEGVAV